MIFVKALAYAILLALAALLVGPVVALTVMSFPDGVCGMYWVIPVGFGAMCGVAIGAVLGFVVGLVV